MDGHLWMNIDGHMSNGSQTNVGQKLNERETDVDYDIERMLDER